MQLSFACTLAIPVITNWQFALLAHFLRLHCLCAARAFLYFVGYAALSSSVLRFGDHRIEHLLLVVVPPREQLNRTSHSDSSLPLCDLQLAPHAVPSESPAVVDHAPYADTCRQLPYRMAVSAVITPLWQRNARSAPTLLCLSAYHRDYAVSLLARTSPDVTYKLDIAPVSSDI